MSRWLALSLEYCSAYSEALANYPSLGRQRTPSSTMMARTCWLLNLTLNLDPLRTRSTTPVIWASSLMKGKMFLHFPASIFLPLPPLRSLKLGAFDSWLPYCPFLSFFPFASASLNDQKYLVTSSSTLGVWRVTRPCSSRQTEILLLFSKTEAKIKFLSSPTSPSNFFTLSFLENSTSTLTLCPMTLLLRAYLASYAKG